MLCVKTELYPEEFKREVTFIFTKVLQLFTLQKWRDSDGCLSFF